MVNWRAMLLQGPREERQEQSAQEPWTPMSLWALQKPHSESSLTTGHSFKVHSS